MLFATNAPSGTGRIQSESYFSMKYKLRMAATEDCIQPVIRDPRRCDILREEDRILSRNASMLR
jgi:hypothetical protein